MATKKVAWNATTRVATVLLTATALPGGSVEAGRYTHPDPTDAISLSQYSHVTFQHVQEILYKFDKTQDMQSVKIVDDTKVLATGLTVAPAAIMGQVGSLIQLVPTVTPAGADDKRVTYTSDNALVAEVSRDGLVLLTGKGETNITVRSADGSLLATTVPVEAVANMVLVDSITVAPATVTLTVASPTAQLVPTVLPADATQPAVTYTSSAPAIATVSATGLVTRVANGTANITVAATDGSGKSAVRAVTCTA